jgi:hypothetical protein
MGNLLANGLHDGSIVPTELSRKLTIDGITKAYQVYRIRLDLLYYNDQNDRIATWISQYKAERSVDDISIDNLESYNDIIQEFIVKSNPAAINKTKNNIELVDQREPGVVLSDGRIIDGNRRFTCLRMLAKQNNKYNYFEAVILDRDLQNSEKQIKMLELEIQHGEEKKVDYNPIDRLVGIYNDILVKKFFTEAEYARSTNETESEIKKKVEQAKLMVEFLEFINADRQFHIARDLGLDGPLIELATIIRKCKDDDIKEDIKNSVFANLLMKPVGDMTRFVRQINGIVESEFVNEFIAEQSDIAIKVINKLPISGTINEKFINEQIRNDEQIKGELERSMDLFNTKVKRVETKNRPLQLVDKTIMTLESIDTNIFGKLSESELLAILERLQDLETSLNKIRGTIHV